MKQVHDLEVLGSKIAEKEEIPKNALTQQFSMMKL